MANDRSSKRVSDGMSNGKTGKPTKGKSTAQTEAERQKGEADEELAVLADGGEERAARCCLPDFVK